MSQNFQKMFAAVKTGNNAATAGLGSTAAAKPSGTSAIKGMFGASA